MQGDVGVVAKGSSQSGHAQSGKGRNWMFRSCKARKDEVEPYDIGLQSSDSTQQPGWSCQAIELPAADHVETGQLLLFVSFERVSVLVGSKFVVGQLISENGQADARIAL